jgi:hypothetical protein
LQSVDDSFFFNLYLKLRFFFDATAVACLVEYFLLEKLFFFFSSEMSPGWVNLYSLSRSDLGFEILCQLTSVACL